MVYVFLWKWHWTLELNVKPVSYLCWDLSPIAHAMRNSKQSFCTSLSHVIHNCMDLNSISLLLAFLSNLKSFSLGRSFRSFFHILYPSPYIREKTGLGRTARTTWEACVPLWCCGHQQHLVFCLQTTSNTPFASLTTSEYWSWGFQNTIHINFKIFFLNRNSRFRNDWMPS